MNTAFFSCTILTLSAAVSFPPADAAADSQPFAQSGPATPPATPGPKAP
jgi:hypothetical protein